MWLISIAKGNTFKKVIVVWTVLAILLSFDRYEYTTVFKVGLITYMQTDNKVLTRRADLFSCTKH